MADKDQSRHPRTPYFYSYYRGLRARFTSGIRIRIFRALSLRYTSRERAREPAARLHPSLHLQSYRLAGEEQ